MPYRWGEHVGELELRVEAETEAGVLADAACALGELLADGEERGAAPDDRRGSPAAELDVAVEAADRPLLLAAWLDELVFLAETEGFVPESVEALELADSALRARVRGRRGSPPHLVKAVTHHALRFEPAPDGGWLARAVLDV